ARSVLEDMQRGEVNRPKVVQTSLYYGVMSRYTSFLVLENQEAYKRFEVERRKAAERLRQQQEAEQQQQAQHAQNLTKSDRKLSDVLATNDVDKKEAPTTEEEGEEEETERDEMAADGDDDVEDAKVAAMDKTIRGSAEPPPPPMAKNKPMPKKRSKTRRSKTKGGLGVTGRGFGGGGKDFGGFDGRGRIAYLPQVIMGPVKADGALSQEAITPVVLRQVGDITACYQQELNRTSELRGRLAVQFTIDATGRVTSVFVPKNTLNEAVGDCIIGKVLRTWSFPSQTGASTEVTVMFNLHRSGQDGTTVASLEALKDRTPYEEERLFQHYVAAKAKAKAARQLNTVLERMSKEEEREAKRLELLLHTQGAAQVFPAELDTALTKALAAQPSAALLRRLIVVRREQKRTEDLIRELIAAKPDPTVASSLIGALQDHEQGKTALAVVDGWVSAMAPEQALQLLNRLRGEGFQTAFSEPFFTHMMTVTATLLDKGKPTVDLLEARIDAAVHLKRPADVVPLVEKHCSPEGLIAMKACDRWVAALRAEPRIQALDAKLAGARLNEIRKIRAQDIANPKLIEQHAELLGNMGQPQEADRVMSEMVEFRPHDYNLRTRYARRLDAKGQTEAACAQLGLAVQVNPAQRDTFRTMMGMRRKTEERAEAIKRCIVDGVSKLPVQRAVSLVLTWEDPRADIDLHIHEAGDGGEHVWYRDRESAIGGLLYYDITDGFGPEIYVLGSGPSGAYRLELVYYSGSAAEVRGTLTVLRNAGSPTETREERPFTLTKAKHGDKTPLTMGEFRL
ncbi:MAG: AgmX/PglI C-terminal domain-containing protein, partial [Myxococcota bacterium]